VKAKSRAATEGIQAPEQTRNKCVKVDCEAKEGGTGATEDKVSDNAWRTREHGVSTFVTLPEKQSGPWSVKNDNKTYQRISDAEQKVANG
jgi:hypothetical protein